MSPSPLFFSFSFSLFRLLSLSVFFLCLLSLSSFSVCWWCGVSSCVCVVWCGVVCRVVWHAENPVCRLKNASVCRFKTSPCVPAPRAHAFQHVCAWCRYTRGRFECTHGGVLSLHTGVVASSVYQKITHVWLSRASEGHQKNFQIFPMFKLRKDGEQHYPDSSNHSLYLVKLFTSSSPGETWKNQP